ncbi:MAG: glyoxalase [Flammeovirgaceae bacterium]
MKNRAKSIQAFIGAKDYNLTRAFYRDWGFEELITSPNMSVFRKGSVAFYLQDYYVKDWVDNTMLFLEVEDLTAYWEELVSLKLDEKYEAVRLVPVKEFDWGKEGFIHDPSGVLWHIGEFK